MKRIIKVYEIDVKIILYDNTKRKDSSAFSESDDNLLLKLTCSPEFMANPGIIYSAHISGINPVKFTKLKYNYT